jgi:hypothetical protein
VIPTAFLQAWSANAPWPDLRQVEQELIICRALCDLFNAPALRGRIALRGGTAIHTQAAKTDVRIIDFVDAGHPALRRMWDKRQRGYRATGYSVRADANAEGDVEPELPLGRALPRRVQR